MIIDLVNSFLSLVSAIDCLCIVVGDVGGLAGFGDGISLLVDQSY